MKKYILFGILAFLFSFIAFIPASIVAKLLPKHIIGDHYQGTLWQGSASNVRINQFELGEVQWQLQAGCLLTLKVCAHINQQQPRLTSSFDIKARTNLHVENLLANGDTAVIATAAQNLGINPSGFFDADIVSASFKGDKIESIEGTILFDALALNGVLRISMGDVESIFLPQEDHTQISLKNRDGHLDLSGVIQLYMDATFNVDLQLSENNQTNQTIKNGLRYLSEPQSDGTYRINQRGKL